MPVALDPPQRYLNFVTGLSGFNGVIRTKTRIVLYLSFAGNYFVTVAIIVSLIDNTYTTAADKTIQMNCKATKEVITQHMSV